MVLRKPNTLTPLLSVLILAFSTAAAAQSGASAGSYPDRPMRLVVGFSPGGPTDVVARAISEKLSQQLGQPVIIDNRPGASGNIASSAVAQGAPDGYIAFYNTSTITTNPWIFPTSAPDPIASFTPVSATVEIPYILVVGEKSPIRDARDLLKRLKDSKGGMNYGTSGVGASDHLASVNFLSLHDVQALHVPYKGSAPVLTDVISGQLDFAFATLNTALPQIKGGKLRPLAFATEKRLQVLPEVPTLAETAPPGMVASAWQGVLFPKNTPAPVVATFKKALDGALSDPAFVNSMASQGMVISGGTTEAYAAQIKSELERWGKVIKAAGITNQ